jgi:DNA-binding transcriptional regulator YhcF (GntR family)
MARKKVPRTLPALPSKRAVQRAPHKSQASTEVLRKVAVKNQQDQPRAFYSLREVETHFQVSYSNVSRVYRQLEEEGLLSRVRGSKTILQALHFDRQLRVRAFVGLPASLSEFVTLQAYRTFFIKIRRVLRLRGFATAMAFFEKEEAATGALSKRLKTYEVDTVLWFQPTREARDTATYLSDRGIRLIGVAHDQLPPIPCRYHVRREAASRKLLEEWKTRHGIGRVTLVKPANQRSTAIEETLDAILDDLAMRSTVAGYRGERSEAFLRALQKTKTGGIIFSSAALSSMFSFRCPEAVTELLRKHRVAFINGPVAMPFAKVPDARVDLVAVDWQSVAEKIVDDLVSQEAFKSAGPTVFEAEANLRVPLSEFAQNI